VAVSPVPCSASAFSDEKKLRRFQQFALRRHQAREVPVVKVNDKGEGHADEKHVDRHGDKDRTARRQQDDRERADHDGQEQQRSGAQMHQAEHASHHGGRHVERHLGLFIGGAIVKQQQCPCGEGHAYYAGEPQGLAQFRHGFPMGQRLMPEEPPPHATNQADGAQDGGYIDGEPCGRARNVRDGDRHGIDHHHEVEQRDLPTEFLHLRAHQLGISAVDLERPLYSSDRNHQSL
jgi:hypothetical protein